MLRFDRPDCAVDVDRLVSQGSVVNQAFMMTTIIALFGRDSYIYSLRYSLVSCNNNKKIVNESRYLSINVILYF